jgi:hypothetical protein
MLALLSLSKSATANSLNWAEIALLLFGIVLVFGLIGEFSERWKHYIKVFELMVIIGVAGELLADGAIFLFSARLQTISDHEVASLNRDAAQAKLEAETLQLEISGANERAASAEAETARLNKLAEDQRRAEAEQERIRRTPPKIVAFLTSTGHGKVNVSVESKNLIPFEYRYVIVTENNEVVAPFPVGMAKVYPTRTQSSFSFPVDLQLERIKNSYIELSLTFQSLSYEELHLEGHAGEIVSKYRLSADQNSIQPIP